MFLALAMTAGLLAGCGETKTPEKEKVETEGKEEGEAYKIGIVTPTLTISEDEFRGAQEMVAKYPDLVVHKTLPEDYQNKEGCISVSCV